MKPSRRWPIVAAAIAAAVLLGQALWIPAKARLAQALLERAWSRTLLGEAEARPWPWADAWPAGILEVPRLGVRQIVLAGASGRNLAFGPTALNGITDRDLVLSGHRDTHFRFLGRLRAGDLLRITTGQTVREFQVRFREVVDSRHLELVLDHGRDRLTLTTCYPLDAPRAGGPLRLVVTAIPRAPDSALARPAAP